jgi:hypothetical protein
MEEIIFNIDPFATKTADPGMDQPRKNYQINIQKNYGRGPI